MVFLSETSVKLRICAYSKNDKEILRMKINKIGERAT